MVRDIRGDLTVSGHAYVGKPVPRVDALEKVRGFAEFASDIELPRMLYARLLRSPHAHARILNIDSSKALRVPGVAAVATGDICPFRFGLMINDWDILARKMVRWAGEPVAAVAAESEESAEEAVQLVEVDYEPLPAVLSIKDAIKRDALLVHEELGEYAHSPHVTPISGTNIANRFVLKKGAVDEGFAKSSVVVENEFEMPRVSHVFMEPSVCMGQYLPDGSIRIWSSTASPFADRYELGVSLGIPLHKITVYVPYVGGSFGGKGISFEPLVVMLSKIAGGRPVKFEATREEQFTAIRVAQGFYGKIKTGVTNEGKIVAQKIFYAFDAGATADYAVDIAKAAGYSCTGPYYVPNIDAESLTVYTNHTGGDAIRGFGYFESLWAVERQMDMVAHEIGMAPVEFRLKNALVPGLATPTGEVLREDAGRLDQCIRAVAERIRLDVKEPPSAPNMARGKGVAALWKAPYIPTCAQSSAYLKFNEDGTLLISVGVVEIGMGTVTALAQMAAEELGLPMEKVKVVPFRHTDLTPFSMGSWASRNLFQEGMAVLRAVEDVKEQILEVASQVLRAPKNHLILKDERIMIKNRPQSGVALQDIVMGYVYDNGNTVGGPAIGRGYHVPSRLTHLDPETGQGYPALYWTFGAQGADIEIDLETGMIKVLKLISAFDIGKAINPQLVLGQIFGGGVQSLSRGMWEGYTYDKKGKLLNANLTDYKIARARDIPMEHEAIIIENPQSDGPYGARGIGEHPYLSVPAAVANAVHDATGIDIKNLPLTPENVWKAIQEK